MSLLIFGVNCGRFKRLVQMEHIWTLHCFCTVFARFRIFNSHIFKDNFWATIKYIRMGNSCITTEFLAYLMQIALDSRNWFKYNTFLNLRCFCATFHFYIFQNDGFLTQCIDDCNFLKKNILTALFELLMRFLARCWRSGFLCCSFENTISFALGQNRESKLLQIFQEKKTPHMISLKN